MTIAVEPLVWIIAVVLLIGCWPLAQRLRHEKLRPLAAYLIFVSVLALVSGGVFWALAWIFTLSGPQSALGNVAAFILLLIALLAGFFAGWWVIRFPQNRQMPK